MALTKMKWEIDLNPILNKNVRIETREGHIRVGVLSRVTGTTLRINNEEVLIPLNAVMDEDDLIPFEQIITLDVLP